MLFLQKGDQFSVAVDNNQSSQNQTNNTTQVASDNNGIITSESNNFATNNQTETAPLLANYDPDNSEIDDEQLEDTDDIWCCNLSKQEWCCIVTGTVVGLACGLGCGWLFGGLVNGFCTTGGEGCTTDFYAPVGASDLDCCDPGFFNMSQHLFTPDGIRVPTEYPYAAPTMSGVCGALSGSCGFWFGTEWGAHCPSLTAQHDQADNDQTDNDLVMDPYT